MDELLRALGDYLNEADYPRAILKQKKDLFNTEEEAYLGIYVADGLLAAIYASVGTRVRVQAQPLIFHYESKLSDLFDLIEPDSFTKIRDRIKTIFDQFLAEKLRRTNEMTANLFETAG